ncbi:hypothetical protein [Rothia sp. ZJ932]|uniref:hypothetical protein n=1 Tax=Rothia sp. ZJ932 TaxID=2810516 RepID=UPI001966FE7F|nr:hypothetical protein [Rothia sp. ZJ932]QRZ60777.1 hypothetical protein JR346_05640 [Rothia sp. ZJ932]
MLLVKKVSAGFVAGALALSLLGNSPVYADGHNGLQVSNSTSASSIVGQDNESIRKNLLIIAEGLKAGQAERDIKKLDTGDVVTYHLEKGIDITFSYDNDGNPIIPLDSSFVAPAVSVGIDRMPYVELDPAEQGAAAAGLAGTLGGVICAALAVESAGVGCIAAAGIAAMVIAVATAHGVCPDEGKLRIYINREATCLKK